MRTPERGHTEVQTRGQRRRRTAPENQARGETFVNPEIEAALKRLEMARERLVSATIAFCDGSISFEQLKAVREYLRQQDLYLTQLTGRQVPPFAEEPVSLEPEVIEAPEFPASPAAPPPPAELGPELKLDGKQGEDIKSRIELLDRKLAILEENFAVGRINATQYRAIRKHYMEQRQVALKLHAANPQSERWRVVLEEGKTLFLMQLNEAACLGFALYDMGDRQRIFLQGTMGRSAEEAMALLGTFGPPPAEGAAGRMLATRTDDGQSLLLVPGRFTAALVTFSQDPPGWQVRAIREVHRNFEAANQAALSRGERRNLVFPDVSRIVKS
ncbi:MAG: hypothetical protein AB1449_00880 [Chloroflexota bacterium]